MLEGNMPKTTGVKLNKLPLHLISISMAQLPEGTLTPFPLDCLGLLHTHLVLPTKVTLPEYTTVSESSCAQVIVQIRREASFLGHVGSGSWFRPGLCFFWPSYLLVKGNDPFIVKSHFITCPGTRVLERESVARLFPSPPWHSLLYQGGEWACDCLMAKRPCGKLAPRLLAGEVFFPSSVSPAGQKEFDHPFKVPYLDWLVQMGLCSIICFSSFMDHLSLLVISWWVRPPPY